MANRLLSWTKAEGFLLQCETSLRHGELAWIRELCLPLSTHISPAALKKMESILGISLCLQCLGHEDSVDISDVLHSLRCDCCIYDQVLLSTVMRSHILTWQTPLGDNDGSTC